MIFNSFKYSGISNSLDRGEDGQFRGCEDKKRKKYSNWKWWSIFKWYYVTRSDSMNKHFY